MLLLSGGLLLFWGMGEEMSGEEVVGMSVRGDVAYDVLLWRKVARQLGLKDFQS